MADLNIPNVGTQAKSVVSVRHPLYSSGIVDWEKWRLAYEANDEFKQKYLVKLSKRETDEELKQRRTSTYVPAFAAAAINDIKNAIFQRTNDVSRVGGTDSYQSAIDGNLGGVDLVNSSMGTFIGTEIITELLVLSKVGVLVDNFTSDQLGVTLKDRGTKHPFLTSYSAENILSWTKDEHGFKAVLLREEIEEKDQYGLPTGTESRYRLMRRVDDHVEVDFFDKKGQSLTAFQLDVPQIPFTVFDIPLSLMRNIADYQIALMNIESSDISFVMKANFPFYFEYYDPKTDPVMMKGPASPDDKGTSAETVSKDKEIEVGVTKGRRFPKGVNDPGFIAPPAETLEASMHKGSQIKDDIRSLLNLNLQALNPRRQSAESKEKDEGSLENSLSYIGLVLEKGEQTIAQHWSMFEPGGSEVHVSYPKTYTLKSEGQRREEASELEKLADKVPSDRFRREVKKKVARTIIGTDVTEKVLDEVVEEIEKSETLTADPNIILSSHKAGLVSDVTASDAIGFNGEEEIPKAKKDRAERAAMIVDAQGGEGGGARGVPELDKGQRTSEQKKKIKVVGGNKIMLMKVRSNNSGHCENTTRWSLPY